MIKKLIVPAFLFFTLISFAQQGTSSPYSFYGIGDVKFKGTAENRAMGGLTIYSDSFHLNFQNPASYSNLKLTTFSLGGTYLTTNLSRGCSWHGIHVYQRGGWIQFHFVGHCHLIGVRAFIRQTTSIFLVHQHRFVGQLKPNGASFFVL